MGTPSIIRGKVEMLVQSTTDIARPAEFPVGGGIRIPDAYFSWTNPTSSTGLIENVPGGEVTLRLQDPFTSSSTRAKNDGSVQVQADGEILFQYFDVH